MGDIGVFAVKTNCGTRCKEEEVKRIVSSGGLREEKKVSEVMRELKRGDKTDTRRKLKESLLAEVACRSKELQEI